MPSAFEVALKALRGSCVKVDHDDAYPGAQELETAITFDNGALLQAAYWRLIRNGRQAFSSFDDGQKYGLPAPFDATRDLRLALENKAVVDASLDSTTGDIELVFADELRLQILNVTAYEIWTFTSPDGAVEYSNYNK